MDHETVSKLKEVDDLLRQGFSVQCVAMSCDVTTDDAQSRWDELHRLGQIPIRDF